MPLLHSRVTRDTYGYLIEKIQRKLAGWKAHSLSLAGRVTLAKSVLSSIPYYAMQSTSLPQSCLKAIEKLTRRFIWGNDGATRKISLVKWEEVCQPLSRGGCGMKRMEDQNNAFLAKLAFQLVNQPSKLWVHVLRSKYNWSNQSNYLFRTRTASYLWKGIAKVWPETVMHINWTPGDGTCIRFWSDSWARSLGPLKLMTSEDIPNADLSVPISRYVTEDGEWNWDELHRFLSPSVLLELATIPIPSNND